ncbi:ATP-binding cassette domain-containing protein [Geobacter pickeringii]|uniref:ABC transporter ATP-binding protein n=1 Tax=Geobacter pickeringii TaxID=345632 RepID=A0A0B5BDW3_9BACT|nr:ATP-binding cassette domain-containing protein [Geobacter pickeringii]AJE02730.1 ABC transporter ATP-binding protein [Geobacter pickeringii]
MPPLYRLNAIRKKHGERTVLAIDDLALAAGKLYTLTGANGSGKTTLLTLLAFLDPPTSGELHFGGEPVRWTNGTLLPLRRQVTLLHQSPYLFNGSVFANVAFGLKVRGIRGDERRRRVEEALALVGLTGFDHRRARELSGGECQRVAMARALVLKPTVLLLDEPLANVDRETCELLERVIVSLPGSGTTVIMTTHDPEHPGRLGGERLHLVGGEFA